jgi:hypothetical protein
MLRRKEENNPSKKGMAVKIYEMKFLFMEKKITLGMILVFLFAGITSAQQDSAQQKAKVQLTAWYNNLYERGVRMEGDTIIVSEEAMLAATDASWRKVLYPEQYTWQLTSTLIEGKHIKKALWYMINLYYHQDHPDLATDVLTSMESSINLSAAMAASFYTFIFFDPEVGHFENHQPVIDHPDVMEGKLNAVRQLLTQSAERRS